MKLIGAATVAAFVTATSLWAQGSGGSHGASPPIPPSGLHAITSRIIQGGGEIQPGRRAPIRLILDLQGPISLQIDAREPWTDGPRPSLMGMNQMIAAIDDVNKHYATGLLIPESLSIRFFTLTGLEGEWLSDTGYGIPSTRYDATTNTIVAGEVLGSTAGPPQSPALSLAVTVHEYGHALFLTNLRPRIPAVRELESLLRQQGVLLMQLRQAGAFLHEGLACQLDPFQLGTLLDDVNLITDPLLPVRCREWMRVRDQLDGVLRLVEENQAHWRINGYSELFSDLVAVLQTGKLSAMTDALALPGLTIIQEFMANVRARRFANCSETVVVDPNDPEEHGYFAPARCELGRAFTARKNRDTLLRDVFQVLSDDLSESIRENRVKDPIVDNERLIRKLREVL